VGALTALLALAGAGCSGRASPEPAAMQQRGALHVLWHASGQIDGSPVVGGRVWALGQVGGVLHALDPATGQALGQVPVGETSRFATPAVYGGLVLVPTLAGGTYVRAS
jgi:streptogramin lyase